VQPRPGQQPANHFRNLLLRRTAGAHHRLLDRHGAIFGHGNAGQGRRQQRHPARVAELERRGAIAVHIGFLDRGFVRAQLSDQGRERVVQGAQAFGDARPAVGRDHAVGDMAQSVALGRHQAPAGEAQARVDAQQAGHGAQADSVRMTASGIS
jgi:hypothetical protein